MWEVVLRVMEGPKEAREEWAKGTASTEGEAGQLKLAMTVRMEVVKME